MGLLTLYVQYAARYLICYFLMFTLKLSNSIKNAVGINALFRDI